MRRLLISALAALPLLFGGAARAVDCGVMQPPTGLSAVIEDANDASGPFKTVHLRWTKPAGDIFKWTFIEYRLEHRDVTAGGAFELERKIGGSLSDGSSFIPVLDDAHTFVIFVLPGHTYEWRVFTVYRHTSGCTEFNDGLPKDSAPSEIVELEIPGPPGEAPRNVVAVAETRKPRVHVSWDPPSSGEVTEYVVERRSVPDDSTKRAETGDFLELVRLSSKFNAFFDRTAGPDETYEYRIAAIVAERTLRSSADKAYTTGKCPGGRIRLWDGDWTWSDPQEHSLTLGATPNDEALGTAIFADSAWLTGESEVGLDPAPSIRLRTFTPKLVLEKPALKVSMSVAQVTPPLVAWATGLGIDARGVLTAAMAETSPFDPGALRTLNGRLTFKKENVSYSFTAKRADKSLGKHWDQKTTLCATVAAGVGRTANGKYAAPLGSEIAIVFQCVTLGPSPLFATRAAVDVTVENGTIDGVLPDALIQFDGDPAGKTAARFLLGAIGPDAKGRSEVATIALAAIASSDPDARQIRVAFKFVALAESPHASVQPLTFAQKERVVEVLLVRPAAGK